MQLIILSGWPATGKTSIARQLSEQLAFPLVSKDTFKEHMFDTLGYDDRAHSTKLGIASYRILFAVVEELLKHGISVVTETAFHAEYDSKAFGKLIDQYQPNVTQIICSADGETLFERFKKRAESGSRHPGHVDLENLDEWTKLRTEQYVPLSIEGNTIELDTTNFDLVDIGDLMQKLIK